VSDPLESGKVKLKSLRMPCLEYPRIYDPHFPLSCSCLLPIAYMARELHIFEVCALLVWSLEFGASSRGESMVEDRVDPLVTCL
jgi:hypothetical protein